jgi:Fibronectin type III domain
LLAGIEATKHNNDNTIPNQVSKLDNVTVDNELIRTRAITNIQLKAASQSVLVSWTPISAQVGGDVTYNVYQINANGTEKKLVTTAPIKEASFNVTGLTNGTEYRFAVTAVVGGKESPLAFALGPSDNTSPSATPG